MIDPGSTNRIRVVLRVTLAAALGGASLLTGCRAVLSSYDGDVATARTHVDGLAWALEQRFTNVQRSPKFANARMRIARYALAPSKLVDDTSLWTQHSSTQVGPVRDLEIGAEFRSNSFRFDARQEPVNLDQVGDERHSIRLTGLGNNDWQWYTEVDHVVGALPPHRVDDLTRAVFASFERSPASVRADYRNAFPRTTRALGRLSSLDSLTTIRSTDGSSLVVAYLHLDGDGLKQEFPNFAKYIDKYIGPASYRLRLSDRSGNEWFDAQSSDRRIVVRFRSNSGELRPLAGGSLRMPDTLIVHVDARTRFGIFTVGVRELEGEFVQVRNTGDRAWSMRFSKEPHWQLPLVAERLLRTPLRRPFEGRGATFRIGFRRGSTGQTLLSRETQVVIRESAIVRFLGNLGFTAMSDFAGKVEEEENRFLAELFSALRADLRAL